MIVLQCFIFHPMNRFKIEDLRLWSDSCPILVQIKVVCCVKLLDDQNLAEEYFVDLLELLDDTKLMLLKMILFIFLGLSGTTPGNNQNVYVNDPNLRYNPTPIYTYHNSTGYEPYNPNRYPQPQPPVFTQFGGSGGGQPKTLGTKKTSSSFGPLGPSYSLVPNILNDPRNVDSSGTIPLFYANGSLATRIPPLKPVDMITFLKKGKTYAQKSGSSLLGMRVFFIAR